MNADQEPSSTSWKSILPHESAGLQRPRSSACMAPIDSTTILIFGGGQDLEDESHFQDAAAILFDTETNTFERVLDCPDALL